MPRRQCKCQVNPSGKTQQTASLTVLPRQLLTVQELVAAVRSVGLAQHPLG